MVWVENLCVSIVCEGWMIEGRPGMKDWVVARGEEGTLWAQHVRAK